LCLSLYAMQAICAAEPPAHRTLVPDDFYRVQDVSDPQVSPDGAWVAYVVSSNDRGADEARSAIWMVSWDGSQHLALTAAAEGTDKPRWSPDGRYLAFMATPAGSEKAQIMLLDRRGGNARQLTSVAGDIGVYAWAPDGKRLVLTMITGESGGAPKPIVIDALHFKQDEEGYLRSGTGRHLYLFDVDANRLDPLTTDAQFNEDLPAWSPDGRLIAFVRSHEKGADPDGRQDIAVIEPLPGALPRDVVRPYAPNNQKLAWSPDGSAIGYLQGIEPKFNAYMQDRLAVVPAAGGAARSLTDKLDRAVTSYIFAADGKSITVAVEDDGTAYPARIDLSQWFNHA
jgi:Tol biopolymer transport system component